MIQTRQCTSPRIPNRNYPPAILLRESYRDRRPDPQRTLANLSDWQGAKMRRGPGAARRPPWRSVEARSVVGCQRRHAHGHVAALLGTVRNLPATRSAVLKGLPQPSRKWRCCVAHDRCAPERDEPRSWANLAGGSKGRQATCSLGPGAPGSGGMSSSFPALSTGWSKTGGTRRRVVPAPPEDRHAGALRRQFRPY